MPPAKRSTKRPRPGIQTAGDPQLDTDHHRPSQPEPSDIRDNRARATGCMSEPTTIVTEGPGMLWHPTNAKPGYLCGSVSGKPNGRWTRCTSGTQKCARTPLASRWYGSGSCEHPHKTAGRRIEDIAVLTIAKGNSIAQRWRSRLVISLRTPLTHPTRPQYA